MDPRPCDNVADLLRWEPPAGCRREEKSCNDENDHRIPPIDELRPGPTPLRQSQFLVCHDFRGSFTACDKWEGAAVSACVPFLFTHWWHIDTFCYFGHKMVTIPPPAFTSLAHRHGVRVLGTLIFEQASGRASLYRILSMEQFMQRTIEKLVLIMQTWRFDGWLIDVEVDIGVREVRLLIDFLRKLTAATKKANPRATILWYDAVCTDGKLEWQNTLNARNREFYDVCDGIFTNYAWTDDDLEDSEPSRGAATVCVGIRIAHGRSGAEKSVAKVLRAGLSVGLFAPDWAVEEVEESSVRFWSSLSPMMNTRPLDFFPFKSTFRNGYSEDGQFFRLRDMDLMPHLAHSKGLLIPSERGLVIKERGKHVLWVVRDICSHRDLRVKIRTEGPGTVTIALDRREMRLQRKDEHGSMVLRPMTAECLPIRMIYVATSEPDTVLTYFEAYNVETQRCLD